MNPYIAQGLSNPARLGWLKSFVETGRRVNIQVIHDEHDGLGVRIDGISQVTQDFSEVKGSAPFMDPELAKTGRWFHSKKERTRAMPPPA